MMFAPILFAEMSVWTILVVIAILLAIVIVGALLLFVACYKRCPSNRIMVIFGSGGDGHSAICIHGGARFIKPIIQDYAFLSLEPMQIEIPLRGALSIENIRVNVPSVFTVAIGTTEELMQNAAIRLLGLSKKDISKQAEDIIFGQLRQVIASMQIEEINRDRETFLSNIQMSLDPELRKIGLILINVNITDITDESGYIEAIGQKAASEAIQKARGDVADNEKMGEIRVAEAEQQKAIQVANANKTKMIGTREAEREQAVRVGELNRDQQVRLAELDKETTVGEQSAQFERESQVKEAERSMRVRLADANASAVAGENLAQATIAASQAELQVKRAEAYQLGETKKREAEASVLAAEHRARAIAAEAEALRIEAQKRAELEAPAKAQKAKTIVEAEALAEQQRIEAEGEAKAIFAKLEAEARGQYEILAKKGDGLQRIIDACGGAKDAFQLLLLEHFDNLVEASAQAISNIKFDKIVVWDGGQSGDSGTTATAQWLHNMAKTLPPMMQVMKEIGGVDIPETLTTFSAADSSKTDSPEKEQ
ncbi:MAG: SPFH domain-containing protein [Planctomycetaceae bacterium]|nr:SPFH domain-containing protein [Planctomycetaceae bacterium]